MSVSINSLDPAKEYAIINPDGEFASIFPIRGEDIKAKLNDLLVGDREFYGSDEAVEYTIRELGSERVAALERTWVIQT